MDLAKRGSRRNRELKKPKVLKKATAPAPTFLRPQAADKPATKKQGTR
jgi:hypothetical protein